MWRCVVLVWTHVSKERDKAKYVIELPTLNQQDYIWQNQTDT
jgi:hypothetical protein